MSRDQMKNRDREYIKSRHQDYDVIRSILLYMLAISVSLLSGVQKTEISTMCAVKMSAGPCSLQNLQERTCSLPLPVSGGSRMSIYWKRETQSLQCATDQRRVCSEISGLRTQARTPPAALLDLQFADCRFWNFSPFIIGK
nr:hypothetical protein HJG63_012395 [Rousettus aegyptiacus]